MQILTRWGFRTVRANRSRTITAILAVVGFFALWTCTAFLVSAAVTAAGVQESSQVFLYPSFYRDGSGWFVGVYRYASHFLSNLFMGDLLNTELFRSLVVYLFFGLLLVMTAILYGVFAVAADESLQDYRILTSAGATKRQIRKSLLLRAAALDLCGASAGIAAGLFAARLMLGAEPFLAELPRFFTDVHTIRMLSAGLLLPPCLMLCVCARAFRRKKRKKRLRASKRGLFRRSLASRVFGTGGTLGKMNCKKNRRYRVIFTVVFAVCLAVPAVLDNTMYSFSMLQMTQRNCDLVMNVGIKMQDHPSGAIPLDSFLQQNADRFGIERCVTIRDITTSLRDCSYTMLDSDQINNPYFFSSIADYSPVVRDGKSLDIYGSPFNLWLLDDATFDEMAQQNGAEADTDGAILYNKNNKKAFIKTEVPPQDITLYFLPSTFVYDLPSTDSADGKSIDFPQKSPAMSLSGDEFLRVADPVSVTKTFRILALTQSLPFDLEETEPILLFPERMLPSFTQLLSFVRPADTDRFFDYSTYWDRHYYLSLSDAGANAAALENTIRDDPRYDVSSERFGLGFQRSDTENPEQSGNSDYPLIDMSVQNLYSARRQLEQMQSLIPFVRTILTATAIWVLLVGVLNIAFLNRMTHRRENAILYSIGMDGRQKTGMLLYESVRYALNSTFFGLLLFPAFFFPIHMNLHQILPANDLFLPSEMLLPTDPVPSFHLHGYGTSWGFDFNAWHTIFQTPLNTWWIFAGGAVLIFVLLVVTDKLIDRRGEREDLIQILKDDERTDGDCIS